MSEAKQVSQHPWEDVRIAVAKRTGTPLQRRFALWGLYLALHYQAKNGFRNSAYSLEYAGQRVGILTFFPAHQDEDSTLDANGTAKRSENNVSAAANVTSSGDVDHPSNYVYTTDVSYKPNAQSLSAQGIYLGLAYALLHIAPVELRDSLKNFALDIEGLNTLLRMLNADIGVPPYALLFTNDVGVSAIWSIAQYVEQPRRYDELEATVKEDGEPVGRITITQHRAAVPGNVSTS